MPDIWDYFKDLFRKAETSSPSQPLIHELIERSEEERQDYEFWKSTVVRRRLRDWLIDQYAVFRVAPDDIDEAIDFLDTPSSKGFVIYFHKTRYSLRDVRHFFDYLKEQVLDLDYRTQISDLRSYNRPEWVEIVERHYLKPRPAFMRRNLSVTPSHSPTLEEAAEKFNQRFGNIMIEHHLRDDRPHYLKFSATSYKDALFTEAEEFRTLMQCILT